MVTIDPGSLAPGYELEEIAPRTLRLSRGEPAAVEHVVRANRSISGVVNVRTRHRPALWLLGTDSKVIADREGNYAIRNVKPGRWILAAELDGREVHRAVEIPSGPAAIRGIDFDEE